MQRFAADAYLGALVFITFSIQTEWHHPKGWIITNS